MGFHALVLGLSHYWDCDFAKSNSITQTEISCMTGTVNFGLGNGIRTPPPPFRNLFKSSPIDPLHVTSEQLNRKIPPGNPYLNGGSACVAIVCA